MRVKDNNNKPVPTGNPSGNAHQRRIAARKKAGKVFKREKPTPVPSSSSGEILKS